MMELSDKEQVRYSRQLMLAQVGFTGQQKLKQSKVLIIGAGGLGSPAALYLAASGIGHLTLIDDDKVELSNLQRQILYKVNHLGQEKVIAAQKSLLSLNNQIECIGIADKLTLHNAEKLIAQHDVILDCSDNFATRYLVNQYCVQLHKPLIAGAAIATQGQLICIANHIDHHRDTHGCYQCIFPPSSAQQNLNCSNAGVFAPLLGIIGAMQAQQCLNVLLGHDFTSQFIAFDAINFRQTRLSITADDSCLICRAC
ncbi:HesA/MoeB/ThiF family protein [Pseudoalteromonas tunicata]|uniref:HesA/MoeB/ThiF family protein n=1 Tax=Pseudoalteromonas tunicata TaxID=314281 RepID=UPI00273E1230|nr:HesA/MoeB/ThiF family protein [Pseudoalteromonas tunicata]MDP5211704.1 HesA/MoeB/ThiF family protein [Pseudoalteromonas tunicata]